MTMTHPQRIVVQVLLADGWHPVRDGSFRGVSGGFTFIEDEYDGYLISGPDSSLLALREKEATP